MSTPVFSKRPHGFILFHWCFWTNAALKICTVIFSYTTMTQAILQTIITRIYFAWQLWADLYAFFQMSVSHCNYESKSSGGIIISIPYTVFFQFFFSFQRQKKACKQTAKHHERSSSLSASPFTCTAEVNQAWGISKTNCQVHLSRKKCLWVIISRWGA